MIDVDSMQELIRTANPVPGSDQLDPEELARFVALADFTPAATDAIAPGTVRPLMVRRRGFAVAFVTALVVLGLVAVAVVFARPDIREQVASEDSAPVATQQPITTGQTDVTSTVPNPALFSKRLVPHGFENPSSISTTVGDLEFEMLEFESSAYGLISIAWTPQALVATGGDRLWWSTDYYSWHSIKTSVPAEVVTAVDDDLVVHGRGGTARYEWDGATWIESVALDVMDVERFAFGPQGAVAVVGNGLWYSTDGVHFSEAEEGPVSGRLADPERSPCPEEFGPFQRGSPVLATETGFVALASSRTGPLGPPHPICAPDVWFSNDGNRWELGSEEPPFGESAAVYEVAAHAGRFVAVGSLPGSPAVVWVSDDGLTWERIDLDLDNIDGIAAGGLGWVITASNLGSGDEEWLQTMMFSADGRTWDGPYDRPATLRSGYMPPQMTVGDDVMFGIGSDVLIARLQE